jgi:hypothetical protein
MNKIIFALLLVTGFTACQNDDDAQSNDPVNLEFEEIAKGQWLGWEFTPDGTFVINSQVEWDDFIGTVSSNLETINPAITQANVNFNQKTVLVVLDPIRPVLGYNTTITNVTQFTDAVVVDVLRIMHPEDEPGLTETCRPYHIVKIPKTTLPITFNIVEQESTEL